MRGGLIYFYLVLLSSCRDFGLIYFQIHYPKDISFTYKGRLARDFGGIFDYFWSNVELIVANPIELCESQTIRNKHQIKGNMVLIKRGSCSFMEKAWVAEKSGAIGAIIYNNDVNDIDSNIDMVDDDSGRQISIPVLWIVGKSGHMMVESMLDNNNRAQISLPYNYTMTVPLNRSPWDLW